MSKREFGTLAAITFLAGLLGGAASIKLLQGTPALAQTSGDSGSVKDKVVAKAFVLVDDKGKELASLRVNRDGNTRLSIYDSAGKSRATLGVTKSGISALMLMDAAEESRVGLLSRTDGSPVLALSDDEGGIRVGLELLKNGTPAGKMYDGTGKTIWSVP